MIYSVFFHTNSSINNYRLLFLIFDVKFRSNLSLDVLINEVLIKNVYNSLLTEYYLACCGRKILFVNKYGCFSSTVRNEKKKNQMQRGLFFLFLLFFHSPRAEKRNSANDICRIALGSTVR